MVSMLFPRTLGLGALVGVFALGCLGPNPWLDVGENDTGTSETGDGDGDGDGDSGDGDGESGDGDGDGDGDSADSCSNVALDPGETALDCGGPCPPCGDGLACIDSDDCMSEVCTDDICQEASCEDTVRNGGELDVDCGGPCKFCEHGTFQAELDDFVGSPAMLPQVAMFSDLSFAVTYHGPMEGRARWFDEFGAPSGPHTELWSTIEYDAGTPIHLAAGDASEQIIQVVEPGQDLQSINSDLFLIQRDPMVQLDKFLINESDAIVDDGDLTVEDSRATLTWELNDVVLVRRFDYDLNGGSWLDIQPFEADTDTETYSGAQPVMARNADGVSAVAWVRCNAMDGIPCSVLVRRFDSSWIDSEPVVVTPTEEYFLNPQVAIADDGRVAVIWCRLDIGNNEVWARMLDADLELDGDAWSLQTGLPAATYADVAALSDGSFAFGWGDATQDRVHLRRYIGPNDPKLPDVGDEGALWPDALSPDGISIASVDNHVVIVWSAAVDMVEQIQGQVLSF